MWYMPYYIEAWIARRQLFHNQLIKARLPPPLQRSILHCAACSLYRTPPPHPEVCVHCTMFMSLLSRPAYVHYNIRALGETSVFLYFHRYSALNLTKEVRSLNN
jgi:hypothetical protein